jgi:hypothetical protein
MKRVTNLVMLDLLFQQAVDWRIKPTGLLAPKLTPLCAMALNGQ